MSATATCGAVSTGARLDDLLASCFLPRSWVSRIWTARELPVRLEHRARNLAPNSEWRAYGDDNHVFFAIACAHAKESQHDPTSAIDVYFLDSNADVFAAAARLSQPMRRDGFAAPFSTRCGVPIGGRVRCAGDCGIWMTPSCALSTEPARRRQCAASPNRPALRSTTIFAPCSISANQFMRV